MLTVIRLSTQIIQSISTPLKEFDLIAGRCVDRELDEVEEKIFQEFINSPDYTTETVFIVDRVRGRRGRSLPRGDDGLLLPEHGDALLHDERGRNDEPNGERMRRVRKRGYGLPGGRSCNRYVGNRYGSRYGNARRTLR